MSFLRIASFSSQTHLAGAPVGLTFIHVRRRFLNVLMNDSL